MGEGIVSAIKKKNNVHKLQMAKKWTFAWHLGIDAIFKLFFSRFCTVKAKRDKKKGPNQTR